MSGVYFDGRLITTPTSASVVNDDAMRNKNLTVGNVAAFVGVSKGGKPKTALRFGSPSEAKATLISGELLDAVLAAFDPSAQTGSPTTVVAIPVQPSLQSSATVLDGSSGTTLTLTSAGYGAQENKLSYKVESVTGGVRFSVKDRAGNWYAYVADAAAEALEVQYTGSEATATVTVSATQVILAAPAGTTVATIALADYPTVAALADRISAVPNFGGTVLNGNGGKATVNALDFVSAQTVKTTPFNVSRKLQAIVDWLTKSVRHVTVARGSTGKLPAVKVETFFTSGSDGTVTNNDWAAAFEVLQTVSDVYWFTPVTGSASLHAMADAHAAYMSTVGRKERRAICGTAAGTSDADAIAAAKALNSDRTGLVHLGHYNYDAAGDLVLYPPYITAALLAGAFAGVNPGTALTNKTVKVRGLERQLRNPTDTDVLINGGVLSLEETDQGYKVVKSISTWLVNDNYNRVELSTGSAVDFVARNVREAVDVLRGEKGNRLLLSRAVSIAESTLTELARQEPQGPGVLAGDAENPPFKNITASLDGDVLRIEFQCSPVIPCNYVLTTIYAVPFSGTATA